MGYAQLKDGATLACCEADCVYDDISSLNLLRDIASWFCNERNLKKYSVDAVSYGSWVYLLITYLVNYLGCILRCT